MKITLILAVPFHILQMLSPGVRAATLLRRTKEKNAFWEFDSIFTQNMNHHLLLFCAPTWPSYYVIERHLYVLFSNKYERQAAFLQGTVPLKFDALHVQA